MGEIASVAAMSGQIYLWGKASRENWAAFAPGFRELTEKEEYVEREDEFDADPPPHRPGPGGVRRPAGAAPDDEGTDAEVSLGNEVGDEEGDDGLSPCPAPGGEEWGSPTVSGNRSLIRLAPEVWPDEEVASEVEEKEKGAADGDGDGGPAPMDVAAAEGNGNGSGWTDGG